MKKCPECLSIFPLWNLTYTTLSSNCIPLQCETCKKRYIFESHTKLDSSMMMWATFISTILTLILFSIGIDFREIPVQYLTLSLIFILIVSTIIAGTRKPIIRIEDGD